MKGINELTQRELTVIVVVLNLIYFPLERIGIMILMENLLECFWQYEFIE